MELFNADSIVLAAEEAASLVRCSPGDDATNGFFVSLFLRDADVSETNVPPSSTMKRKHDAGGVEGQPGVPGRPSKKRKKKKKKGLQTEST